MRFTKDEIVECLKLEREVLSKGGYGSSVRDPRNPPRYLRDSVTCLNHAFAEKRRPCSECALIELVPEALRREEIPCHHIPLNERGETIASLDQDHDRASIEAALAVWIDDVLEQEANGA